MIHFACPYCHRPLTAPPHAAGRAARCGCGGTCTVPAPVPVLIPVAPAPVAPPPPPFTFDGPEPDDDDRPRGRGRRPAERAQGSGAGMVAAALCALLAVGCLIGTTASASRVHRLKSDVRAGAADEDEVRTAGLAVFGCAGLTVVFWSAACLCVGLATPSPVASAGAFGALVGGALSVPVSQYAPLFGGVLATLAQPWSPVRIGELPAHFIALVAACGGLAALLRSAAGSK